MVGNFRIAAGLCGRRRPHTRSNPTGSSPLLCQVPSVLHTSDAMLGGSSLELLSYESGRQDHTDHLGSGGLRGRDSVGTPARLAGRRQHSASAPQTPRSLLFVPSVPRSLDLVEQTPRDQVPSGLARLFLVRMAAATPSVLSPPSRRVEPIGRGGCDSSITLMGGTTSG